MGCFFTHGLYLNVYGNKIIKTYKWWSWWWWRWYVVWIERCFPSITWYTQSQSFTCLGLNLIACAVVRKPFSSVLYPVVGAFTNCTLRLFTFSMLRSTQRTVKLLENSYHTKQHTMWQLLLTTQRRWSKLRTLMLPQGLDFYHFIIIFSISYSVITIYVMKLDRNKYNLFQRQDIGFFV